MLLVCSGILFAIGVSAQQPAPGPPPGFTQDQYDKFVDAISRAVVDRIREQEKSGRKSPGAPAPPPVTDDVDESAAWAAAFGEFLDRIGVVARSFPALWNTLQKTPSALDQSGQGGRGPGAYFALLTAVIALMLLVEQAAAAVLTPIKRRLTSSDRPDSIGPLSHLVGLAFLDMLGLLAIWLVVNLVSGLWFSGFDNQPRLGNALLNTVFTWRLYMFGVRIVLRPDAPSARLAHMPSVDAVSVYRRVSLLVILILCGRMVLRVAAVLHAPPEALAAGRIAAHLVLFAIFVWACFASRDALAGWFTTLLGRGGGENKLGKYWLAVAVPLFGALVAAQVVAAGTGSAAVPDATLFTLNAVMASIFLRTLLRAAQDRLADHMGLSSRAASLFGLVARCASAGFLIILGLLIARAWIVDVFGTVDAANWQALARSSTVTGVILFLAYVTLELVRFFTRLPEAGRSAGMLSDEDQHGAPASRLVTLMPVLRTTLVVFVVVIATLVLLSEHGVNTAPLIAGASIFGLALSFGSQTLVRDVVSGIFYLADDAFRVGEYIDCGKAKGTVEGFTLRSIRLRHQNGQVHTIPFGQLGQITNFSRDWTTVKFNLRFTRETEVEKLRKAVKKLGQEMLDDPQLKDEFLAPLKMQGIVDVAENALVVRFKFTVRPGKPSYIQREAVKRLIRVCREAGVEFASSLVSVQTHGAALDQITAGAAVQSALQRPSGPEARAVDIDAR